MAYVEPLYNPENSLPSFLERSLRRTGRFSGSFVGFTRNTSVQNCSMSDSVQNCSTALMFKVADHPNFPANGGVRTQATDTSTPP
jgi:hypothetical protein